ncbi:MAG: hypothetical protein AAGF32_05975 [Pseudomonadota bacterium]
MGDISESLLNRIEHVVGFVGARLCIRIEAGCMFSDCPVDAQPDLHHPRWKVPFPAVVQNVFVPARQLTERVIPDLIPLSEAATDFGRPRRAAGQQPAGHSQNRDKKSIV